MYGIQYPEPFENIGYVGSMLTYLKVKVIGKY